MTRGVEVGPEILPHLTCFLMYVIHRISRHSRQVLRLIHRTCSTQHNSNNHPPKSPAQLSTQRRPQPSSPPTSSPIPRSWTAPAPDPALTRAAARRLLAPALPRLAPGRVPTRNLPVQTNHHPARHHPVATAPAPMSPAVPNLLHALDLAPALFPARAAELAVVARHAAAVLDSRAPRYSSLSTTNYPLFNPWGPQD